MLMLMEDNIKIFVVGLKKWAKIHKVNQADLGKVVSRHQSSISAYYKDEARPTTDMINKWVAHYGLDHEEILEAGRQELQPIPPETMQRIDVLEAKVSAFGMDATIKKTPPQNDIDRKKTEKNQPHHDLVNEFEQPAEAYELNCILRKIEKLEKGKFKKIKKFLLAELEELEEGTPTQEEDQGNETG